MKAARFCTGHTVGDTLMYKRTSYINHTLNNNNYGKNCENIIHTVSYHDNATGYNLIHYIFGSIRKSLKKNAN
jgi:hypothetical protein